MKIHSFRLKIALLSGLLSGGLLIVTGVLFWQLNYRMDLDRIDRELRNLGQPQLDRVNGGDHWIRFESALGLVGGASKQPSFTLWVRHDGRVLHQSANWPKSMAPESFPTLTVYEPPFVQDPDKPPPPPPRRSEPISANNPALPRKVPQFYTRTDAGKTWRMAVMGNPYMTIILGADLDEFMASRTKLRDAYLAAIPLVLLLVAAGSWWVAARALRPVDVLTQAAEGIKAEGLDQRIPAGSYDPEMARLITVFNAMLDRLERSFHQANRFSADAAHELKTPLAIMQAELEDALHTAEPGSAEQSRCSQLIEEIARLRAITDKLLLLAQADAGKLPIQREPLDLTQIVSEAMEDVRVLAPDLIVEEQLAPQVRIVGDPHLLPHLIQNLTTNAAKYNCEGGKVLVTLTYADGHVVLRVANTGPGIPAEDQARLFERFHRVERSRSRQLGGTGLGLSLAREVARAHGGSLVLESSTNELTTFCLTLPAGGNQA